jgi:hypothetical protein
MQQRERCPDELRSRTHGCLIAAEQLRLERKQKRSKDK